jgi:hypothetical protein
MEGLGALAILVSVFGGLVFFIAILSIAIDSARLLRRANKLIQLQEQQTRYLAAISTNLAKTSPVTAQPRAA